MWTEQRERRKKQAFLFTKHEFRCEFGEFMSSKWGFFVDHYLTEQIHEYADWVVYPTQDHLMREYSSYLQCGLVSSDGHLFYCIRSNQVHLCALQTGQELAAWKYCLRYFTTAAYHPGMLAVADNHRSIYILNDRSLELKSSFWARSNIRSLNFNSSGDQLISCSGISRIEIWDVPSGECRMTIRRTGIHGCAMFVGDSILALSSSMLELMDGSGSTLHTERVAGSRHQSRLSVNSDQSLVACCGSCAGYIFKHPELELVRQFESDITNACFHPSNPRLLAVSEKVSRKEYKVIVFDVHRPDPLAEFRGHIQEVSSLCFTPDGQRLISLSHDCTSRMWNVSHLA